MNIANEIYSFGADWQNIVNQAKQELQQKDIRINQLLKELTDTKIELDKLKSGKRD